MRRGAKNPDGTLSLPGVGKLPTRVMRGGRRQNLETKLARAVLARASRHPDRLVLRRVQCGVFRTFSGHVAHGAEEGTPDFLGSAFVGGFAIALAVEWKIPGEGGREKQIEFIEDLRRRGGLGYIEDDLETWWAKFNADLVRLAETMAAAPFPL